MPNMPIPEMYRSLHTYLLQQIRQPTDEPDIIDDGHVSGAKCAIALGSPENARVREEVEFGQTV